MENTKKRYWKGIEELKNDINVVKNADREFNIDNMEGGEPTHRRDFLKVLGFGMAAVTLASCDVGAHVRKTIPYLNKPLDVEPGIANYYSSTFVDGSDVCSVLVKTREGRPVKIEGNKLSGITGGGTSARAQASVLSLYDNEKLKTPVKGEKAIDWKSLDKEIKAALSSSKNVAIVSNTITSPTAKAVIADFTAKYAGKHITYDANSMSAIREANETSFGSAVIPGYRFDKAEVIVGINCDFLGTWISPVEFSKQWATTRRLSSAKDGRRSMSRHYQFETGMTITGAAADYRSSVKPSQEGLLLANLYNMVAKKMGGTTISAAKIEIAYLDKCATDLVAANGKAIVVSATNNVAIQNLVNAINGLLGSVGSTIDFTTPYMIGEGNDTEMNRFVTDLNGGIYDAVIFMSNPIYDHPESSKIAQGLKKTKVSISLSDRINETAALCQYTAATSHYLENWGDAELKKGYYSLIQPTITHIYDTRQAEASLLTWTGVSDDYQAYLKKNWNSNILNGGKSWVQSLHDGVYEAAPSEGSSSAVFTGNVSSAAAAVGAVKSDGIELHVFENVTIGTGSQANNPWLQETPDPISKVTWENTAAISQITANKLEIAQGDIIKITLQGAEIELPVMVQPGQAHDTISVALGYGRTAAGKAGNVGVNVFPMVSTVNGNLSYWKTGAKVTKTNSGYTLAQTQTHETVMGRQAVVQESILSEYVKNVQAGRFMPKIATSEGPTRPYSISLWNGHDKKNHSWGMVIDLNTCTGCSNCLVSCQSENNVAVVGKKEVARAREMHWIRLDRYYSSDADITDTWSVGGLSAMEQASDSPEVVIQPMMCQHCSNAPCETVCPVLATTHSSEGLNQMTYNRCIGTRYCANNCPYKVRRFNWWKYFENDEFDFNMNNELGRMVLNPDVTVRSRGVIEKCSMCVQRIQLGKLEAKKERRRPVDGEIETACSQSCPTGAITFGDMLDPESRVSQMLEVEREGRAFHVLEEINVQPQLNYLTKIRNKDKADAKWQFVHTDEGNAGAHKDEEPKAHS
ncbi:MAG: MoCo/4Fe-4S cofactor protein with predicted Tat translocation signal [Oceanospirillaceae bacterium]|jgi:MoCo/4Fe-4S cofactor protein with predicted Tat translocation signal